MISHAIWLMEWTLTLLTQIWTVHKCFPLYLKHCSFSSVYFVLHFVHTWWLLHVLTLWPPCCPPSLEVRGRVETVSCLRAEEAVYHKRCLQLLSLQRDQPTCERELDGATPAKKKCGIYLETDPSNVAFFKVIEFLEESDEEHLTMKQCQD